MTQTTAARDDVEDIEALFRRTMASVTDIAWRLRCDEEALAALYDVIEQTKVRLEADANGDDDVHE